MSVADLNPAQFPHEDPEDPATWKSGDIIKAPDREVTLHSGKQVTEPGQERMYAGPGNSSRFVTVVDHTHPAYKPEHGADIVRNSLVVHQMRVFKDNKVRHHKEGGVFRKKTDG